MKKLLWLTTVVAVFALTAQPAGAVMNLSLAVGNAAISGFAGPYGNVAVTRIDATHASLVYTSNVVGGNIYLFGDGASIAFNINSASVAGTLTASNSGVGFTPGPFTPSGIFPQTVDGHGDFNVTFNDFDGYTHSIDYIKIDLTNVSGTWASDADVLTPNALGHSVAAHIFVTSYPANQSNGALATGYATDGTPPVPEPASMLLLGLGLATSGGIGAVRRRFRK